MRIAGRLANPEGRVEGEIAVGSTISGNLSVRCPNSGSNLPSRPPLSPLPLPDRPDVRCRSAALAKSTGGCAPIDPR
jgi:hypothetical protein